MEKKIQKEACVSQTQSSLFLMTDSVMGSFAPMGVQEVSILYRDELRVYSVDHEP